jgi:hypothetical protein
VIVSSDVSILVPLLVVVLPTVDVSDIRASLGVLVPAVDSGY